MTTSRSNGLPFTLALIFGYLSAAPLSGQQYAFGGQAEGGVEVARVGSAIIIESEGPRLFRTGPIILEHGSLHNRWLTVQDSTMGVVFTEPSGVKMNSAEYDGDIDLRALKRVIAVEVRALLFNVWGDYTGQVTATRLVQAGEGQGWAMDPRWVDMERPAAEHRTSVTWIHRVMFADETTIQAQPEVLRDAVERLTGKSLPELGRAMPAVPRG